MKKGQQNLYGAVAGCLTFILSAVVLKFLTDFLITITLFFALLRFPTTPYMWTTIITFFVATLIGTYVASGICYKSEDKKPRGLIHYYLFTILAILAAYGYNIYSLGFSIDYALGFLVPVVINIFLYIKSKEIVGK